MAAPAPPMVKDELGEKVQKLFQDFLEEYAFEPFEKLKKNIYLLQLVFFFRDTKRANRSNTSRKPEN
jgi:hypothetical protein